MVNELNQQIIITNCSKKFKTHKKKKEKMLMPRPTNIMPISQLNPGNFRMAKY